MPPVSDAELSAYGELLFGSLYDNDDYDVIVYCDGSADQDGDAGWAAIYFGRYGKIRQVMLNDSSQPYTSQEAELCAAMLGLFYLKGEDNRVLLVTDSNYVVRCFNEGWLPRWRRKNWIHNGQERPNRVLWETLEAYVELQDVTFQHTPGHAGEPANEQCHMLANYQRERCKRERMESGHRRAVEEYRRQYATRGARDTTKRHKKRRSARGR